MTKKEKQILKDMEHKAFKAYKQLVECCGEDELITQKAKSKWSGLYDIVRTFDIR